MTEEVGLRFSNLLVLEALPGRESELEALVTEYTVLFRSEDGCLRFDCFQSFEDPSRFMLQVEWRDRPSLEVHLASESCAVFFRKCLELSLTATAEADYRNFSRNE